MRRTLTYVTIMLLTLTVANCGPGLLAPGPPLPGLGPGFEWIALFAIIVAAGAWLSRSKFATFFQTYDKGGLRPSRFSHWNNLRALRDRLLEKRQMRATSSVEAIDPLNPTPARVLRPEWGHCSRPRAISAVCGIDEFPGCRFLCRHCCLTRHFRSR